MNNPAIGMKLFAITVNLLLIVFARASDTTLVDLINLPFHVKSLASDNSGTIWISSTSGLYYFDGSDFALENPDYSHYIINNGEELVMIDDYRWTREPNGMYPWYLFDHWTRFLPGKHKYITQGTDKKGRHWIASGSNLYIFEIEKRFTRIMEGFSTRGIYFDEPDKLFVNTYSGVTCNGKVLEGLPKFGEGNFEKVGNDFFIAWAGILKFNLETQDKKSIHIDGMFPNGQAPPGNFVHKVYQSKDTLWVGTSYGLGYVKNDSLVFISDSIYIEDILATNDRFLIATYGNGVLERLGNRLTLLDLPDFNYNQIQVNDNKYYFASDRGLVIWDGDASYEVIGEQDGLTDSYSHAVLIDPYNFIWVSTNIGLNRIDPDSKTINQYLTDIEFNKRSFLKKNEELYFGSVNGVYKFSPKLFLGDEEMPQISPVTPEWVYASASSSLVMFFLIGYYFLVRSNRKKSKVKEKQMKVIRGKLFFSQVESVIFQNDINITVQNLADFLDVSERTLYRTFKEYDATPGEFLKTTKLRKARSLIENNKMKDLSEIAHVIGYSESYFKKLFKEEFGVKPLEWASMKKDHI